MSYLLYIVELGKLIYKKISRHEIVEILLKMGLNTNQSINQFYATDTKPLKGASSSNINNNA